jgi:hypothetical protein
MRENRLLRLCCRQVFSKNGEFAKFFTFFSFFWLLIKAKRQVNALIRVWGAIPYGG